MPPEFSECWGDFLRLNSTRPIGMGVGAINYSEILAYFTLMNGGVQPWEVMVIKALDSVFLKVQGEQMEKERRSANQGRLPPR